ncbi:glycosyltransferase family 39 protein [Oleiagrimonas sp. C23AA]|uniref:ArnT family glycosyltransferase n=1 Tax=Oleiagrimonas sp. C23AA TaxID=2719047 RepID=UPI0014238186|nr:glycosyltransferase family 39 protein [Oleiagrimonas sp. C23AA]NII10822.1 glycosyl transferase [Oleiagrimonas sp. C23AA]
MLKRFARCPDHLRTVWPWLALWSVFALFAIFLFGPMPLYSTRTLAVAWEMWSGHHWIVPYINGHPYSHKVPLLYWLMHAGWAVFGVNDVWPRLLEVGFGAAQLVLVSVLARRLFPARPWLAKAAPWILMSLSYAFLFGLQIMYEVLLAVCVLSALLCLAPAPHRQRPRWWLFALWLGAGLLTKGPVMLLHVVFPWLLGPLWHNHAREHRARWYGAGALAILGGLGILVAWVIPAIYLGGPAYEHMLLFKQTTGRMVDAFDHAHPLWWYLPWIPVIIFPFSGWLRSWVALGSLRRPFEPGLRFLLCWLLPMLLAFSLISGKQTYYPLPEYGGIALLLGFSIAYLRENHPKLARTYWLGSWPLALGAFLLAGVLLAMPSLLGHKPFNTHWFVDLSVYSRFFGVIFILLGALLLLRGRGELRRVALAGLVGTFSLYAMFIAAVGKNYDLAPANAVLRQVEDGGHSIGNQGFYQGQFQYGARLTRPVDKLYNTADVVAFAKAHPEGVIVTYPHHLKPTDLRFARLVQPFRGDWLVIWPAPTLAAVENGQTPAEPATPTRLYPSPDYWRYRRVH